MPARSLTIFAICNPKNIDKVNTAISEELTKLLADGVTAAELARAKQGYLQQQQVARTNDAVLAAMLTENVYVDRTMDLLRRAGKADQRPDARAGARGAAQVHRSEAAGGGRRGRLCRQGRGEVVRRRTAVPMKCA